MRFTEDARRVGFVRETRTARVRWHNARPTVERHASRSPVGRERRGLIAHDARSGDEVLRVAEARGGDALFLLVVQRDLLALLPGDLRHHRWITDGEGPD